MKVNKNQIYKDVDFLTRIKPARNYKNIISIEKAASYIENEFRQLDCVVENQYFIVDNKKYRNVIASFNPKKKKRLIVGAHYDVYGEFPGADDNASAVAGLLETSRLLDIHKPELDYRIDFVAYCLEEPPFFGTSEMGSAVPSTHLFDKKIEILGMLCFEMIGYFSEEPNSQDYPISGMDTIYPNKGNFIIVAGKNEQEDFGQKIAMNIQQNSNIETIFIADPRLDELLGLSDHFNYWKYGFNAVMINDTSFMRNPNYHQSSDTIDTLDFDKMAEVINGSYYAVIDIKT